MKRIVLLTALLLFTAPSLAAVTANVSSTTPPFYTTFSGAYWVITNDAANETIVSGATVDGKRTVWYAVYPSEAAFQAGAQPLQTGSFQAALPDGFTVPAGATFSATILDPLLLAYVSALPGVTNTTIVEN